MVEGAAKAGRRMNAASYYKEYMIAAGFTNVVETTYYWPNNSWPKDKKLKKIGKREFLVNWNHAADNLQDSGITRIFVPVWKL